MVSRAVSPARLISAIQAYSILYVRSTDGRVGGISVDDLNTHARIRDAAITCFASRGFDATVREIATRAGVSAGLITHHFGSKDALRAECDAEVLRHVLELKVETIRLSPTQAIARAAQLDDYGATFGYTLRSVREGGEAGRAFLRSMIDDAREYTAAAVEAGIVLPSRDPEGRLELLVTQAIGGMILQLTLHDDVDFSDGAALIRSISERTTFAQLELYTQGLLPDSSLLDAYVRQTPLPDAATSATQQHDAGDTHV
jgi:AcrR family transcriptional regulator